jgi:molybdopterin synthase catalytic subunit
MIALSAEHIDPIGLLRRFTDSAGGAGAIVSFTGVVRGEHDGAPVERLWLDHHERMTEAALAEIGKSARERFGLIASAIVHRVGELAPGEPIVFVAAAAAHRRAAFDAVDYAMDRIKSDVPLWKRETRGGAEHWIEARPSDLTDRARWEVAK